MKKLLLFTTILSTTILNNQFATIIVEQSETPREAALNNNDFEKKSLKKQFIEKLQIIKSSKEYKSKTARKLTKSLEHNYKLIDSSEDKKEISKLIRDLAKKDSKNAITIKKTILNSINKLTNKSSIICLTIITFMYQMKGIITAPELFRLLEQMVLIVEKSTGLSRSIGTWKTVAMALPIVTPILLKIFGS